MSRLTPGSVRAGRGSPAAAFWRRLAADDAAHAREAVASSLTGSISAVDAALAAVRSRRSSYKTTKRTSFGELRHALISLRPSRKCAA